MLSLISPKSSRNSALRPAPDAPESALTTIESISIKSVRKNGGARHLPVLQYFDAATAAAHMRIPVMVAAALFDPAVPPPGQFAVFNCLAGEKKLFVRQAAHVEWEGAELENREVRRLASKWFVG